MAKKNDSKWKKKYDIDQDGIPNWKDKDMDGDGINNKKDKDIDGDGIKNKKDKTPKGPKKPKDINDAKKPVKPPKDPPKKPEEPKEPNTLEYDIFSETPEVDETNTDTVAELVDNLRRNLQSSARELVSKYSIKEVDQIPKNFARSEKYNDEDRLPEFDLTISEDVDEENDTLIPAMIPEVDFEALYKFGSVRDNVFVEDVPNFTEDGSVTWDIQLTIPDTIGIEDYIIEYVEE